MRTQHKTEYHRIALLKSTGKPISIEKADRGLKCNAVCPECEKDFVAAQGEKKEWYFRHNEKTNCKGGQESALHKLAKEIICRNLDLQVTQKARIQYSNPVAEINQDEFRPDITAKYGEEILYFEVVVSNPVSPKKANKYISYEIKTIVIDLSKYEYQTEIELEKYIIENTNSKKVLFWVKKESISLSNIFTLFGILGFIGFLYYTFRDKDNKLKPITKGKFNPKYKSIYEV
ncbi:MAG: competence protein CoiA family protein [Chitinophagales bacterium]